MHSQFAECSFSYARNGCHLVAPFLRPLYIAALQNPPTHLLAKNIYNICLCLTAKLSKIPKRRLGSPDINDTFNAQSFAQNK